MECDEDITGTVTVSNTPIHQFGSTSNNDGHNLIVQSNVSSSHHDPMFSSLSAENLAGLTETSNSINEHSKSENFNPVLTDKAASHLSMSYIDDSVPLNSSASQFLDELSADFLSEDFDMQDSFEFSLTNASSTPQSSLFTSCKKSIPEYSMDCMEINTIKSVNDQSFIEHENNINKQVTEVYGATINCPNITITKRSIGAPAGKNSQMKFVKYGNQQSKSLESVICSNVFASPSASMSKMDKIKMVKGSPISHFEKTAKCNYNLDKPVILYKSDIEKIGDLQPYCHCTGPSDENLVLKEQTIFAHGQKIIMTQFHRIACFGFELIAINRGSVMFVCQTQIVSFGFLDHDNYKNIQKYYPDHVDIMTSDEVLFVQQHTGMRGCSGLISLELLAFALKKIPNNKRTVPVAHNEPLFYKIVPGHWCEKRKKLIRSVSAQDIINVQKTSKKITRKKCSNKNVQHSSDKKIFVVQKPDGQGYCIVKIKSILVADKELMSFSLSDTNYVNCLQLCQYLENFPWKNFSELATSLNIDFLDAPKEVVTYFTEQGHNKDIVAGKWTSMMNLRLISCFSVGQMNDTDFLSKNSILTEIAKGDFTEVVEKPLDILQLAASEIREMCEDPGHFSENKNKTQLSDVRKQVMQELENAKLYSSDRAKNIMNPKVKKTKEKVHSSQMNVYENNPTISITKDVFLNDISENTNSTIVLNDIKNRDCNEGIVILQNDEGTFLECTPLCLKPNAQQITDLSCNNYNPENVSLGREDFSENTYSQTMNKYTDEMPDNSIDLSIDFDTLVRTPSWSNILNREDENEKSLLSETIMPISSGSQDVFMSPDSGIYTDVKSFCNTPSLDHVEDEHEYMISEDCEFLQQLQTHSSVDLKDHNFSNESDQSMYKTASKQNIQSVSKTEFENTVSNIQEFHQSQFSCGSESTDNSRHNLTVKDIAHVNTQNGEGDLEIKPNNQLAATDCLNASKDSSVNTADKVSSNETCEHIESLTSNEQTTLFSSSQKDTLSNNSEKVTDCKCSELCHMAPGIKELKNSRSNSERENTPCTGGNDKNSQAEQMQVGAGQEKAKIQGISYSKDPQLVTVFKQLLPMINITNLVDEDRLQFHLSLDASIKQMLMKKGTKEADLENIHKFLKVTGKLVCRALLCTRPQAVDSPKEGCSKADTADTSLIETNNGQAANINPQQFSQHKISEDISSQTCDQCPDDKLLDHCIELLSDFSEHHVLGQQEEEKQLIKNTEILMSADIMSSTSQTVTDSVNPFSVKEDLSFSSQQEDTTQSECVKNVSMFEDITNNQMNDTPEHLITTREVDMMEPVLVKDKCNNEINNSQKRKSLPKSDSKNISKETLTPIKRKISKRSKTIRTILAENEKALSVKTEQRLSETPKQSKI